MAQLYEFLYTSEIALEENPTCVADIIRVSRMNNTYDSITGLLMFDGLRFCQYLEGPREAVLRLAEKIARDSRHVLFEAHDQGVLGERRFAQWSMAYVLEENEEAIPSIAAPEVGSSIQRLELLLPSLANNLT